VSCVGGARLLRSPLVGSTLVDIYSFLAYFCVLGVVCVCGVCCCWGAALLFRGMSRWLRRVVCVGWCVWFPLSPISIIKVSSKVTLLSSFTSSFASLGKEGYCSRSRYWGGHLLPWGRELLVRWGEVTTSLSMGYIVTTSLSVTMRSPIDFFLTQGHLLLSKWGHLMFLTGVT
jgi:hypothetical protein